MDPQESMRLKKEYAEFSDEQLIELAIQGKDDFVEGAYNLIMAEVRHRNIEEKIDAAQRGDAEEVCQCDSCNTCAGEGGEGTKNLEELMPFIIILKEDDLAYISSILDDADIAYCVDPLHLKGREYPRLMLVPKNKVDQAIELLSPVTPKASIFLWR